MNPAAEIRTETPGDHAAIRTLLEQAFGQPAEADLVGRLRQDDDLVLSLVAVADRHVGHVAFSRLALPATSARGSALAPLAVAPSYQRQGIGAALVREGLRRLESSGEDLVLVLGEPAYYGRFGFRSDAATLFQTPYDGPYLQALAFSDAGRQTRGPVRYARAFAELG